MGICRWTWQGAFNRLSGLFWEERKLANTPVMDHEQLRAEVERMTYRNEDMETVLLVLATH